MTHFLNSLHTGELIVLLFSAKQRTIDKFSEINDFSNLFVEIILELPSTLRYPATESSTSLVPDIPLNSIST